MGFGRGIKGIICLAHMIIAGLLFEAGAAQAASNSLCIRNFGDVPIRVAVIYKGRWGGWFVESWWVIEPGGAFSRCTSVPEKMTESNYFYLGVRQEGADGRFGSTVYDVAEITVNELGLEKTGGSFTLVPRSNLESNQTRTLFGERNTAGMVSILCVPNIGTKEILSFDNQVSCPEGEILTVFGTRLLTSTDGGMLDHNSYEVIFGRTERATVFYPPFTTGGQSATLNPTPPPAPERRPAPPQITAPPPPVEVVVPLREGRTSRLGQNALSGPCAIMTSDNPHAACERVLGLLDAGSHRKISCVYGPIQADGTGFRTYEFWANDVPDDLASYDVPGAERSFAQLGKIAIEECPPDLKSAEKLYSETRF